MKFLVLLALFLGLVIASNEHLPSMKLFEGEADPSYKRQAVNQNQVFQQL
jgi:hypothetical protein